MSVGDAGTMPTKLVNIIMSGSRSETRKVTATSSVQLDDEPENDVNGTLASSSCSTSSSVARKQHVRFATHEFLEISHAPHAFKVLDQNIINELWWQAPELTQMKRNTRKLLMVAMNCEKENPEDWIGLDRFTPQRIDYKKRAIRLVLLAQHQQRTHGVCSSEHVQNFIRAVSRKGSQWTRNMSHAIGQRLFQETNATFSIEDSPAMLGSEAIIESLLSSVSNTPQDAKRKELTSGEDPSLGMATPSERRVKPRVSL